MNPRRPYEVVDAFEEELAAYCGSPFAVAVDSCTNALFLSLRWMAMTWPSLLEYPVRLPKRTYIGVLQAAQNAGFSVDWVDRWNVSSATVGGDFYTLSPLKIADCARYLRADMYWEDTLMCLSFHAAKQLPIGRGGAILTDNKDFVDWARRARQDGRTPGDDSIPPLFPAWHMYMTPDYAARGLWLLSRLPDSPPPLPQENYPDLSMLCEPTAYEVGYGY